MLRSRALEITVEGCLASPLPAEHAPELARLLAAFLPGGAAARPGALVAAVARLAELLAADDARLDALGAAQRAVAALVCSLKSAAPAASGSGSNAASTPAQRLAALDAEMAKEQGFLSKASSQGVVTREHLASAARLVSLQQQKLDLLHGAPAAPGGGGAAEAARRAAAGAIAELRSVVEGHLELAQAQEAGGGSGAAAAAAAATARGDALAASLQREEAKLSEEAGRLAAEVRVWRLSVAVFLAVRTSISLFALGPICASYLTNLPASTKQRQIRSLEAQLTALRAQAADVDAQRARLRQRKQAGAAAAAAAANGGARANGGGSGGAAAPRGPPPSHYLEELAAADALLAVADPAGAAAASPEL